MPGTFGIQDTLKGTECWGVWYLINSTLMFGSSWWFKKKRERCAFLLRPQLQGGQIGSSQPETLIAYNVK